MRKFTLPILLFLTSIQIHAQQDGYQTHFQFNEVSFNPSYAGKVDGKICFSSLLHQQFLGFESDPIYDESGKAIIKPYNIAPHTEYFTISTRIYNRLGIAFQYMKDEIGPQKMSQPKINLSYYFNFGASHLSIGCYAGMMQKSLDGTKLIPLSLLQAPYLPDPNVPINNVSDTKKDLGFGLHYLNKTFNNLNLGLGATHLVNSVYSFVNSNQKNIAFSNLRTHYYFNGSMDFPIGSSIVLQPNVLLKYGGIFQYDLNVLAIYNTNFYGGLSYRQADNLNMMVGYLNGNFKVGYAFDFIVNGLKPGTKTSHELFISYCYPIKSISHFELNPRHLKDYKN